MPVNPTKTKIKGLTSAWKEKWSLSQSCPRAGGNPKNGFEDTIWRTKFLLFGVLQMMNPFLGGYHGTRAMHVLFFTSFFLTLYPLRSEKKWRDVLSTSPWLPRPIMWEILSDPEDGFYKRLLGIRPRFLPSRDHCLPRHEATCLTWGDNSHGEDLACDSKSKDSWNLWHAREGTILLEKPDFFYKKHSFKDFIYYFI